MGGVPHFRANSLIFFVLDFGVKPLVIPYIRALAQFKAEFGVESSLEKSLKTFITSGAGTACAPEE